MFVVEGWGFLLICYYNGSPSGTRERVKCPRERELKVVNLYLKYKGQKPFQVEKLKSC